ncbi:hypothetical protein Echvi_4498 [Echinicola vietnamensis DSM 17526]|uniref:Uncharacterized protein n=1 Tax=Echinicola vietnamensis (strain DSM 17526 / LMG 23754 / KMM 6221) TaxID=926556 RepID=L0G553_ECHVK|nr:hypothetical protein Echvi_4498 [Echinicola vietnamensis DSM 17526]
MFDELFGQLEEKIELTNEDKLLIPSFFETKKLAYMYIRNCTSSQIN